MTWYKWIMVVAAVWLVLAAAILYGTSKDVWEAGNSCYIAEGK